MPPMVSSGQILQQNSLGHSPPVEATESSSKERRGTTPISHHKAETEQRLTGPGKTHQGQQQTGNTGRSKIHAGWTTAKTHQDKQDTAWWHRIATSGSDLIRSFADYDIEVSAQSLWHSKSCPWWWIVILTVKFLVLCTSLLVCKESWVLKLGFPYK
jgi:hypothetical protein